MSRPSPQEHLLSAFGACWTEAIGWLSPDPGHGNSRKESTYPPLWCPRGREAVCQAPYGTASPPGAEVPCSCAFLVKHRPGRAKNSLSWDQSRARKWWERVSSLPGEPASLACPRQSGRVESWAGEEWLGSSGSCRIPQAHLPLPDLCTLHARALLRTPCSCSESPARCHHQPTGSVTQPVRSLGVCRILSSPIALPPPPCPHPVPFSSRWSYSSVFPRQARVPTSWLFALAIPAVNASCLWISYSPLRIGSGARSSWHHRRYHLPWTLRNKIPKPELPGQTWPWISPRSCCEKEWVPPFPSPLTSFLVKPLEWMPGWIWTLA